jgi:hypothetical protein
LVDNGTWTTVGVEVDSAGGKMYWSELCNIFEAPCATRRANLDGTNAEILAEDVFVVRDMEMDATAGELYVMASEQIGKLDVSGPGTIDWFLPITGKAGGLALDLAGGKVYWAVDTPSQIARADLDGTDVEVLPIATSFPRDIEVDSKAGKIYWSEIDPPRIRSANLDGSGVVTVTDTDRDAWGIALGPAGSVGGVAALAPPDAGDGGLGSRMQPVAAVGLLCLATAAVLRRLARR